MFGTGQVVGPRRRPWRAGALVVAIGLVAGACGIDTLGSSWEPKPKRTRLDGSELPAPVSNLVTAGGLVAYYAAGSDHGLDLVAVDPDTARVAWTRRARLSFQPPGVAVDLAVVDGAFPILTRPSTSARFSVELVDPDGTSRWKRTVPGPLFQPEGCDGAVCVTSDDGTVVLAAADGASSPGPSVEEGFLTVGSDGGAVLGVAYGDSGQDPATGLSGVSGEGDGVGWAEPLANVFGKDRVTPNGGWAGSRYGSTWVLWLGGVSDVADGEQPEFPYSPPPGSTAGLDVADGSAVWKRSGEELCGDLSSERVLVLCAPALRYPSATANGEAPTSSFDVVDPATGRTTSTVDLDEPLDVFDTEGRLLVVGRDRWLLRDGDATELVDLATGTVEPADASTPGWCRANTEVDEVDDSDGEPTAYSDPGYRYPCVLGAEQPTRATLTRAVARGRMSVPDDWSVAEVGSWVVWVQGGHLAGARRS